MLRFREFVGIEDLENDPLKLFTPGHPLGKSLGLYGVHISCLIIISETEGWYRFW
jgi:hypothetical protein